MKTLSLFSIAIFLGFFSLNSCGPQSWGDVIEHEIKKLNLEVQPVLDSIRSDVIPSKPDDVVENNFLRGKKSSKRVKSGNISYSCFQETSGNTAQGFVIRDSSEVVNIAVFREEIFSKNYKETKIMLKFQEEKYFTWIIKKSKYGTVITYNKDTLQMLANYDIDMIVRMIEGKNKQFRKYKKLIQE